MADHALKLCVPRPGEAWSGAQLRAVTPCVEKLDAPARVRWALDYLPPSAIVTSSFGAQAAVMLHLLASADRSVPVVLIDTGYLFPETYAFVDTLQRRLGFELKVYRGALSPAWQEARYGRLWEQGAAGIRRYNDLNKVEPMARALEDLVVGTWFSGVRRRQSASRAELPVLTPHGAAVKVHPIFDWSDRDVHAYLRAHDLPYHPLWEKGYVSIGDWHTSRPAGEGEAAEETRFFGLTRECGLHEPARYAAAELKG